MSTLFEYPAWLGHLRLILPPECSLKLALGAIVSTVAANVCTISCPVLRMFNSAVPSEVVHVLNKPVNGRIARVLAYRLLIHHRPNDHVLEISRRPAHLLRFISKLVSQLGAGTVG